MKQKHLLYFFLLMSSLMFSQKQISGKVTDKSNIPLGGVTVIELGTKNGTTTDFDGNFILTGTSIQAIQLSYIGFKTLKIVVENQTVINTVMEEDLQNLEEVVLVGFGTQKKINLSGAVNSVTTEQLSTRPISNISQGLQGLSPGLNVDFNSGTPGANPVINIRGFTSINGGEPLIVIDGVPSDVSLLNLIAPESIESISVLKDASSAAIYGARAAFGVLLITTKSGNEGQVNISINSFVSVGTPTVIPNKTTDPYIYLALQRLSEDNTPWSGVGTNVERLLWARERSDSPISTQGVRESINNPGSWEYMGNKNWVDYFLSNATNSINNNINVSGGSDKVNYFLSASNNKHNGSLNIADDYFTRTGIKSKVNVKLSDWLSIGNNTSYLISNRKNPSYFNIQSLYNFAPTDWDKNPDGSWANTEVGVMGATLTDGGNEIDKNHTFQTTFSFQSRLIANVLSFNGEYTYQKDRQNYDAFYSKYKVGYGPNDIREQGVNRVWKSLGDTQYEVLNLYATLNQFFGKHQFSLLGGYNQENFRNDYTSINRDGVISASLPSLQLATGTVNASQNIESWALRGVFYRANYSFNDKYILELNGRYDGSSKFPKDKRYGFFPSLSGAWNIAKEEFLKSQTSINLLKLRASYGSLGNQSVGPFDYIPSMSSGNGNYVIDGQLPRQINSPGLVSSNYTWENVVSTNFGLDIGVFKNKLNTSLDYFIRDTKGMLTLGKDLPGVLGASEPKENAGDLRTKGWELSIDYKDQFGSSSDPFNLSASINVSDSKSTITKFDNPNNSLLQYYEGMEIGEIWGLSSNGFFNSKAEIQALDQSSLIPWGALEIVEGWPKYVDLDGNGAIETGLTANDPKDLKVIGNMLPRYRFGINLNMDYRRFDLGIFLQGVAKRDYYPRDYLYWGFFQQPYSGGYTHLEDFYRASNDSPERIANHSQSYINAGLANANTNATYPVLQAWLADRNLGERIDESKGLSTPQTNYLLDGSYLRLKNISFGYTIPSEFSMKAGIKSLRIYFSGENLFEWSKIAKFFDPESISDISNRINPAYSAGRGETSGYQYPYQRRYSFGMNLNF
jgi:TonB-linked SusC/RagA family outer membrane protein